MLTDEDYKNCRLSINDLAKLRLHGYTVDKYEASTVLIRHRYILKKGQKIIAFYKPERRQWDIPIMPDFDYLIEIGQLRKVLGPDRAY